MVGLTVRLPCGSSPRVSTSSIGCSSRMKKTPSVRGIARARNACLKNTRSGKMWPETPCKICGTMTIDEGGFCSKGCLQMEGDPTACVRQEIHQGDPGDEHLEPMFIDA